jgi:hypothetical protein
MRTIQLTLHEDLDLSKKSARWVPKLLTSAHKEERIQTCGKFLPAVSFHTPESKLKSKQWTKKGQPGLIKAKVHATRNKQMVLVFFDNEGLIYTNYVPKGQTVNANYIVDALSKFLATFKKKRPNMAAQEWFFHWDNALVHTAAIVKDWMAARDFRLIDHPPYSLFGGLFLIPNHQKAAGGQNPDPGDLQDDVGGGRQEYRQRGLRRLFRRWYECCEKCVRIGGGYVEKS